MAAAGIYKPRFTDFRRPAVIGELEPKRLMLARLERLRRDRSRYDAVWRQIADNISPHRPRFLDDRTNENRPASRSQIINNKASIARRILQAGLHSGVSSPSRPWFKLTLMDRDLAKASAVSQYLADCTSVLQTIFALSNVYQALLTSYGDLGDYGNSCIILDEDFENVITARALSIGEYWWALGRDDRVNVVFREFRWDARNMVMRWGYDRVSQAVKDAWDRANYDQTFDIVWSVEPNVNQVPGLPGVKGAPYVSLYAEKGGPSDEYLSAEPWREFRASCGRWDARSGDVYAEGPGSLALGDMAALQVLERRNGQAIDKGLRPSLSMPAGSQASREHDPGGVVFTGEGQGAQRASAIYEPNPQWVNGIAQEIVRHETRVDESYFVPLFQAILMERRSGVTAREIAEMHEEKLIQLGPVLERIHTEKLDTIITFAFAAAARAGILPDAPPELENVELRIKYTSILAQAQEMVGIGAIERTVGFVGQLGAVDPSAFDSIDMDETVAEYADRLGTPARMIRSKDDIEARRASRAQAQQGAQAGAELGSLAQGAKVLSEAKMGDDSALSRIAAGLS